MKMRVWTAGIALLCLGACNTVTRGTESDVTITARREGMIVTNWP